MSTPSQYPGITIKGIIGTFYQKLEEVLGGSWPSQIAMDFSSNQETETYPWLGMTPAMREWVGGRNAKGLRENGLSITNKKWELTLGFDVDDLRRDKTGQIQIRIGDAATRAGQHWASLLSLLIENGESRLCYDGQFFFDTDHEEGASGAQSNDIAVGAASATAPTPTEYVDAILLAIQQMYGYKDDQGEPMNGEATSFLAMVPVTHWASALKGLSNNMLNVGSGAVIDNVIVNQSEFRVGLVTNPRLTWDDKFTLIRTDADTKPFIMQEEEGVTSKVLGEGSDEEFHNDRHLFGLKALRNVGYGYWQQAVLATFTE